MTSDGISDADWSCVEESAEDIVAARMDGADHGLLVANMHSLLDRLKVKYGRLPSILATEADYVENSQYELSLLKEAYLSACEIGDTKNIAFIAASLSEYYLEGLIDIKKAGFWKIKLEKALEDFSDSYLSSVLADVGEEIKESEQSFNKIKGSKIKGSEQIKGAE